MDLSQLRRRSGGFVRRHRRLLAAGLAFIAALLALNLLSPAPDEQVSVVVAARDLPAGTALSAADLTTAHVPARGLAPGTVSNRAEALGSRVVIDLPKGAHLPRTATLAQAKAPPGMVLVPFTLADPSVTTLLRVGSVINVVAQSSEGSSRTIARNAVVHALIPPDSGSGTLATGASNGLVVIATDVTTAEAVAGATNTSGLAVTLSQG